MKRVEEWRLCSQEFDEEEEEELDEMYHIWLMARKQRPQQRKWWRCSDPAEKKNIYIKQWLVWAAIGSNKTKTKH